MSIIDDKIAALEYFKNGINWSIEQELRKNEHIISEMNSVIQLFEQGITSEGVEIDSYQPYTARTISIKRAKGQPVNRVTLRDTGDFHLSIEVEFFEGGFKLVAKDVKATDLIKKYGKNIIGLTEDNKLELLHEYIYPALVEFRDKFL